MIEADDLRITLQVAGLATLLCMVYGLPLAWVLARKRFPGRGLLEAAVTLPLVLPPTVVGYYLLRGLGQGSATGRFLSNDVGIRLVFTWEGAAIAASILAALLFIRTARQRSSKWTPSWSVSPRRWGARGSRCSEPSRPRWP